MSVLYRSPGYRKKTVVSRKRANIPVLREYLD
jgi:hypothetical protein